MMEIVFYVLSGALCVYGGFLLGQKNREAEDYKTIYKENYGRINGLYEPVKRGGKHGR